jgi:trans-aconitate methyltransferase
MPFKNPNLTCILQWDTNRYQSQHSFVYKYGNDLVDTLAPKSGELIVDLGCGTGELTYQIHQRGATVIGIDSDSNMIDRATQQYPNIEFRLADAQSFEVSQTVDAFFSNAALHWIPNAESCVERIAACLRPNGRFIAEFGGAKNVHVIASFLEDTCGKDRNPWYFPTIAQYATLLENHGIEVVSAELYDRPTPLIGEDGLRNWIEMFAGNFLEGCQNREEILQLAEKSLKPKLYQDDQWIADYRRIRVVGFKV